MSAAAHDPMIGSVLLGRYRVVHRLAEGGMGVLYLARAEGAAGFIKPVVVKRLRTDLDQKEVLEMFVREAKILSDLRHPNIAGIVDFAEERDAYLMVLEYVHGYDLGLWCRYIGRTRGGFDVELALHILIKVLEALHYAHTARRDDGATLGIVHRDVSTSNVVIDSGGHVKLIDFGVAKMLGEAGAHQITSGTIKGKPAYLAPELVRGQPPSPSTDLYAAAATLHYLLTGDLEFRGPDFASTMIRVLQHTPSRIAPRRADVSEQLDEVIQRALAKKPEERYASALELAEALKACRKQSAEEAEARLAAAVQEDFLALPQVLGVEDLATRERSWRTPPEAEAVAPPEAELEGAAQSGGSAPAGRSATRRSLVLALAAAALLLAAISTITLVILVPLRGGNGGEAERVFIVQQAQPPQEEVAPGGSLPGEIEAGEAEQEPGEQEPGEGSRSGPSSGHRPRRPPPPGEALTATFARERARVEACFRREAASLEGRPRLTVHFTLARSGEVRSAEVLPPALGSTSLGRCVAHVARSVRFAPQARDGVSFRIPLTVERE